MVGDIEGARHHGCTAFGLNTANTVLVVILVIILIVLYYNNPMMSGMIAGIFWSRL